VKTITAKQWQQIKFISTDSGRYEDEVIIIKEITGV